jgi:hypothetical protein
MIVTSSSACDGVVSHRCIMQWRISSWSRMPSCSINDFRGDGAVGSWNLVKKVRERCTNLIHPGGAISRAFVKGRGVHEAGIRTAFWSMRLNACSITCFSFTVRRSVIFPDLAGFAPYF